jgi:hypothetical protein
MSTLVCRSGHLTEVSFEVSRSTRLMAINCARCGIGLSKVIDLNTGCMKCVLPLRICPHCHNPLKPGPNCE